MNLQETHIGPSRGATDIYLAGIPIIAIMKTTGYKSEKEFMQYITAPEAQPAIELMGYKRLTYSETVGKIQGPLA